MKEDVKVVMFSALKTLVNSLLIAGVVLLVLACVYRLARKPEPKGADLAIALAKQSVQSGAEDVAAIIKQYIGVSEATRIDRFVQGRVDELRGVVQVKGWSAREADPGIYVVSFAWKSTAEGDMGIFYEVDVKNRYVRPIVPDDDLALKYGIRSKDKFDADEAETLAAIRKVYPDAAMRYSNHLLKVDGKPNGDYDPQAMAKQIHGSLESAFKNRKDRFLKVEMTKGPITGTYEATF